MEIERIFFPKLSNKDISDLKSIINTGINTDNEKLVLDTLNRTMKKLVYSGGKKMKKVEEDKYINKFVRMRRVGYVALGKVNGLDRNSNYEVEVLKILEGQTKIQVGSTLGVSTREMPKIATVVTGSIDSIGV